MNIIFAVCAFFLCQIVSAAPGIIAKKAEIDTRQKEGTLYLLGDQNQPEDRLALVWPGDSVAGANRSIQFYAFKLPNGRSSIGKPVPILEIALQSGTSVQAPLLSPNRDKILWREWSNGSWLNVYDIQQRKVIYRELTPFDPKIAISSISWSKPNGKYIFADARKLDEGAIAVIDPLTKGLTQIEGVRKWKSSNGDDAVPWSNDSFYFVRAESVPGMPKLKVANLYKWTEMSRSPELAMKLGSRTSEVGYFHFEASSLYLYSSNSVYQFNTRWDRIDDMQSSAAFNSSSIVRWSPGPAAYPLVKFDGGKFSSADTFGQSHGNAVSVSPIRDFWFADRFTILAYGADPSGPNIHRVIRWTAGSSSFDSETLSGRLLNPDSNTDRLTAVTKVRPDLFHFETLAAGSSYFTRSNEQTQIPAGKFLMEYDRLLMTSYGWGLCFSEIDERYHSKCQPGIQLRGAAKSKVVLFPIETTERSNLQWFAYAGNPEFISLDASGILNTWVVSEY